jgi:hypothetical protein
MTTFLGRDADGILRDFTPQEIADADGSTVQTGAGAPSGAPPAGYLPLYIRTDPTELYFWTGSEWIELVRAT